MVQNYFARELFELKFQGIYSFIQFLYLLEETIFFLVELSGRFLAFFAFC